MEGRILLFIPKEEVHHICSEWNSRSPNVFDSGDNVYGFLTLPVSQTAGSLPSSTQCSPYQYDGQVICINFSDNNRPVYHLVSILTVTVNHDVPNVSMGLTIFLDYGIWTTHEANQVGS